MPTASETVPKVAVSVTPKAELKRLLLERDPLFFDLLRRTTVTAETFEDVISLSTLRRRAVAAGFDNPAAPTKTLRLALIGGYSFYPLHELVQHFLEVSGYAQKVELLQGSYDNYVSEILEEGSPLYEFRPQVILLLPAARRCKYPGRIYDAPEKVENEANRIASDLLQLCATAHRRSGAEIILANLALPADFDPGAYRTRSMASDWSFTKLVNLGLGRNAPAGVHICDVEFLSARRGTAASHDARGWFESKQPWAPDLQMDVAREVTHMVSSLRSGPKKVAVLDLDNTLWGGVIGDDGLEGIEIGDTSPRGEAFKAFQQ
jgi:predicted enzyme involved in methoxymalonyl-ACP biosynthesis